MSHDSSIPDLLIKICKLYSSVIDLKETIKTCETVISDDSVSQQIDRVDPHIFSDINYTFGKIKDLLPIDAESIDYLTRRVDHLDSHLRTFFKDSPPPPPRGQSPNAKTPAAPPPQDRPPRPPPPRGQSPRPLPPPARSPNAKTLTSKAISASFVKFADDDDYMSHRQVCTTIRTILANLKLNEEDYRERTQYNEVIFKLPRDLVLRLIDGYPFEVRRDIMNKLDR